MKRYIFKSLLTFAVPALLLSFTLAADRASYAGNWTLNESKSELGEFGGRFSAKKIKVDQTADGITIAKTIPGFNGGEDQVRTETITFDGKTTESTYTGGFGTSKRKSTIKWSDDSQAFTITFAIAFEGNNGSGEITGTEKWSLSADGKTLTAQSNSSSQQGDFSTKAVYDKQ